MLYGGFIGDHNSLQPFSSIHVKYHIWLKIELEGQILDGQQINIFEARLLPSYMFYLFIRGGIQKNSQKQSAKQYVQAGTMCPPHPYM